jgi:hypothetical protein
MPGVLRLRGGGDDRAASVAHHRIAARQERARVEAVEQAPEPLKLRPVAVPPPREQHGSQGGAARRQPLGNDRQPVSLAAVEPLARIVEPLALRRIKRLAFWQMARECGQPFAGQ